MLQKNIAVEHGTLLSEIESKKAQAVMGSKWLSHARDHKACKICQRPFATDAECTAFQQRFAKSLCAFPRLCLASVLLVSLRYPGIHAGCCIDSVMLRVLILLFSSSF